MHYRNLLFVVVAILWIFARMRVPRGHLKTKTALVEIFVLELLRVVRWRGLNQSVQLRQVAAVV